jgi:methyl acetate hydrolase
MSDELQRSVDAILQRVVSGDTPVAGVAAIATDRQRSIYAGEAGIRRLGSDLPFTTDTVCAIFSATKAIAGTVALSLLQEGALDIDVPAKEYAPAIGELQVLDGFGDDGSPRLRAPKREITTRMLLTHTAGFGYDFFNESYFKLARQGQPSVVTGSRAAISTPLLFDPGERWEYGSNIDWVGQVIEGITGQRLGETMRERIFEPLQMTSTAFAMTDAMRSRLASVHQRADDGTIAALDLILPQDPEIEMAGHGLYSTVEDYVKFIRMWLNDGAGPDGQILDPQTVEMAAGNHLGELKVKLLPGVIPSLSNDAEFFPGMPKSWAITFMINDEDAPTGRPAGSLAWAGLANLYFWIDRRHRVGGFWATQLFPFADPTSVGGYLAFESAVYQTVRVSAAN